MGIFFLSGFSFTDTDDSQDSRGREGTIFYSTLALPPAQFHVRWLSHIFNCTYLLYLPDCYSMRLTTLSNYHLTDWCDVNLNLFTWRFDSRFLWQQFETGKRWTRTRIDYHPCITSEPTNQGIYLGRGKISQCHQNAFQNEEIDKIIYVSHPGWLTRKIPEF